jgi:serine/threonine-protein kinase HipA
VSRAVDTAEVFLWNKRIGAVFWDEDAGLAAFEYDPKFQNSKIELAPLMMPLGSRIYRFPGHRRTAFKGLPGMLADSLPDDFGNAVIDQWLAREGRDQASFSPVERLCYIGQRGMGALEFRPSIRNTTRGSVPVEVSALTELAQNVLDLRDGLKIRLSGNARSYADSLDEILRVGTSAGGARAKAVVAWNPDTNEMRSGQVEAASGFEYWILKFDGVSNREHGVRDPQGYGRIEYAYYLMATAAGITMMPCRLLQENGRNHFMTQRFDRQPDGEKLHMQSLFAIAHLDNQLPGAHSYEQAFDVMHALGLGKVDFDEQFRRMVFNVFARNQDDHTKNIAYLMDKSGGWSLSPAFDVIYAWNPDGDWTSQHQMTINGLRDGFTRQDLLDVAARYRIRQGARIIEEVTATVARWQEFASAAGVDDDVSGRIATAHRVPE